MLRDFLAYAESGGATPASGSTTGATGSGLSPIADPLRADLARRLRREGLTVHEEFGSAAQRIDLAVEDPHHRGRALIAIETDGPRYAALSSTRDRDRLRPEQLERLGWTHVRVWSTDLFRDPAREISRILGIVRRATATETAVSPRPAAPVVTEPSDPAEASPSIDSTTTALDAAHPLGSRSTSEPSGARDDSPAGDEPLDGGADSTERTDATDQTGSGAVESLSGDLVEVGSEKASRGRRRRVFRQGTNPEADAAHYTESTDPANASPDSVVAGEMADDTARDRWLEEQRPPHYE